MMRHPSALTVLKLCHALLAALYLCFASTFAYAAPAATYDFIDTNATFIANARHPIYTKVAFARNANTVTLKLLALKSDGAIDTSATDDLIVSVVDIQKLSPSPTLETACKTLTDAYYTTSVSLAATDKGTKNVTFTFNNMDNTGPVIVKGQVKISRKDGTFLGCSTDTFTIRPAQFDIGILPGEGGGLSTCFADPANGARAAA